MRLKNKTALITGASRGIGAAIARAYAREGAKLVLVARNAKHLEAIDDEVREISGQSALLVPMDLGELTPIDQLAQGVHERFGGLDILVGNAGLLGGMMPLTQFPPKIWHQVMRVNVAANWHLIRAFDHMLRASPHGRALFVTSDVTRHDSPYCGPYVASKAALEAMVRSYAAELKKTNLRVNLINPGGIETHMLKEFLPGHKEGEFPYPDDIMEVFIRLAEESCMDHGAILNAQDHMHAA